MANPHAWREFPATYREREMRTIVRWIAVGESCTVVGLVGSGRSNLLGYLCHRPDVLQSYLPTDYGNILLIPVDIYHLPANDLSSLYRSILHAFYWLAERLDPAVREQVINLYLDNRDTQDPFPPQKALYDLMRLFEQTETRVVLVLNRFDRFVEMATPQMVNTFRGLRDAFRDTLSYVVGMLQEAKYAPDPASLGDMYELFDNHVCWVGAMNDEDGLRMLDQVLDMAQRRPNEDERAAILTLSGNFPSLIKAIAHWWLSSRLRTDDVTAWPEHLLHEGAIRYRLQRIWNGLTQEEKLALSDIQSRNSVELVADGRRLHNADHLLLMAGLEEKGLVRAAGPGWTIRSELLQQFVAGLVGRVRGRIWFDDVSRTIYQGVQPVEELTALQVEILRFLLLNPRSKQTRDTIIDNAWPEEDQRAGITPNALQVHIASIRKRIEPNPAQPRYLLTWHGRPGGYQFYPEGKPD